MPTQKVTNSNSGFFQSPSITEHTFNLLVIGPKQSGTSSLILKFADNVFYEKGIPDSLSSTFKTKSNVILKDIDSSQPFLVGTHKANFQLRAMTVENVSDFSFDEKGIAGIVFVADMTNIPHSIAIIEDLYLKVREKAGDSIGYAIAASKYDLVAEKDLPSITKSLKKLSTDLNIDGVDFVSAKEDVSDMFTNFATNILEKSEKQVGKSNRCTVS